ncbi:MAG: M13 family metallopeptidase [Myxococcota bacterium]
MSMGGACKTTPVTPPAGPTTSEETKAVGEVVHAVMDEDADPCTDFYRYACGQWLDETTMPSDQPRYGRFNELREQNEATLRGILDEAVAATDPEPAQAQLGTFYGSCLDEQGAETNGIAAIEPLLARIDEAKSLDDMMVVIAELQQYGARPLFNLDVDADYDNPDINVTHLGQSGLGMPDRNYYLEEGEAPEALRKAYAEHVATVLAGLGDEDAARLAESIVALETELAKVSIPRDQIRDPDKRRNKTTLKALKAMTPKLSWDGYLAAVGRPDVKDFNVVAPSYMKAMAGIIADAKPPVRRAYLRWHLAHGLAEQMPPAFSTAHYEFFDKRLRGQAEPAPRWRTCIKATDRALGENLGRKFVEQRFAGQNRQVANDMIAQIEEAFAAGLPGLEWMDDPTRQRALEKMHAVVNKIGHPEQWRDYSSMELGTDHLANVMAGRRFEWQRQAKEIGEAVDQQQWHMTPSTVNAYYNPSSNEMVFPAGILQPPFFSADYPMAMNFGGIGMVMGHELTHGFDDNGRKFDGDGRLTEWWGADAVTRFEERAACVEELYSGYEVQPGVNLNGKLTLGENIADFGGIRQAFGAYQSWADSQGGNVPQVVEGLTNEQLLFVSFGQIWCSHATPEVERVLATTDSHSHPRYRVNGPLSNYPEFWEAFSCEEGTPMHPANVCQVW